MTEPSLDFKSMCMQLGVYFIIWSRS